MPKLTKHEIAEYYSDPKVQAKLLGQIGDVPVLAVQSLSSGENVYRRKDFQGKPLSISNAKDLSKYTSRRFSEFHPVVGKTTTTAWVDIDPGPGKSLDDVKQTTKDVYEVLKKHFPGKEDLQLSYTGGRGFHIRATLDKINETDTIRNTLNSLLKDKFKDREDITTGKKPSSGQIRLDTSTLKNTGSIRALYSLNSETGRVAVPIESLEALKKFDPEKTDVRKILKSKEFAPGIPKSKTTHPIPEAEGKIWTLAIQEHKARKAGTHWDLRLVDPHTSFAHSWAVPKSVFPESKPILAIQTPTHTSHYALNFGSKGPKEIAKGYGAGTVEIKHKEPVKVLSASPDRIKFQREDGSNYTLWRSSKDKWLFRNSTVKEGSDMHPYLLGKMAAVHKLGLDTLSKPPSRGESQLPLESNDEDSPIGMLTSALNDLPNPKSPQQRDAGDDETVEGRLNRQTSWSSPFTIPLNAAEGPSPVWSGFGI